MKRFKIEQSTADIVSQNGWLAVQLNKPLV